MNINFSEILVILGVTLLLFGPDKLPEIARQFGKLAAEARRATNSVRREFYNSVYQPADEVRRDLQGPGEALRSLKAQVMAPPEGARGVSSRDSNAAKSSSSQTPPEDTGPTSNMITRDPLV